MIGGIWLTEQVALIGSGEIGLSQTHDCHVYLVDTGEGGILFDAGAGIEPELIVENIHSLGFPEDQLTHLFLTHCHPDHAGGAAYFQTILNVQVCAGERTAKPLIAGDEMATSLVPAREEGIYPANYHLQSLSKVDILRDGERLQFGDMVLEVLETPGHSADSICYRVRLAQGWALFCGDTLCADGRLTLLNTYDSNPTDFRRSIQRLANITVDGLFPGHGLFLLSNAEAVIQELHNKLSRSIFLPPVLNQ